ncbi:serine/threonine-protein kinase-like protein At5g23170 [Mercurialis annua]|uniref:serine/threonine-protein kinase-like protein At5g23170 n=1 Tax=Mercurialis annua TaxID=3986 RepID=UPI00215F6559|nr:serine/threonine-protein kinase-like protein At5g23170 [Mercurialis annua]
MAEFDYQELVKATQNFSHSTLIGKGSHGSVYKAILFQENKILAIKKSSIGHDHVSNDNIKKLDNEISVLSSLPPNPNIIKYLGTSIQQNYKLLVIEFMPNGSLQELLHATKIPPPSWSKRIEIALQIAKAIHFLHQSTPTIIHRDIKSANILFDSNWNAKLADYGLAVSRVDSSNSSSYYATQPAGTIGYMDPCYTIPSKLSTKNDVFSFGVVLLEIISSKKVIDVNRATTSIVEWAMPLIKKERLMEICDTRIGLPPQYIEGTIRYLLYVAARCVSCNEENRPSMGEIVMGMSFGLVERVRVEPPSTSWVSLIRSFMAMRRKKKLAKKCHSQKFEDYSDITKGKVLLREILADIK